MYPKIHFSFLPFRESPAFSITTFLFFRHFKNLDQPQKYTLAGLLAYRAFLPPSLIWPGTFPFSFFFCFFLVSASVSSHGRKHLVVDVCFFIFLFPLSNFSSLRFAPFGSCILYTARQRQRQTEREISLSPPRHTHYTYEFVLRIYFYSFVSNTPEWAEAF